MDVGAPSSLESLFRLWYDKDPEAQKAEGSYADGTLREKRAGSLLLSAKSEVQTGRADRGRDAVPPPVCRELSSQWHRHRSASPARRKRVLGRAPQGEEWCQESHPTSRAEPSISSCLDWSLVQLSLEAGPACEGSFCFHREKLL